MKDKQQIFLEMDHHLSGDEKPSVYLSEILTEPYMAVFPFTMLSGLIKIAQSPVHHPEGNVWNHTLMVVDHAANHKHKSGDERVLMWSALLHDLGKVPATRSRKGRITAYDHDKFGEDLAVRFLKDFEVEQEFIQNVAGMVRWHMQMLFVVKDLPFANIPDMLRQVSLQEIGLLAFCDRMGRGEMNADKALEEEENLRFFFEKCQAGRY